MCEVIRKTLDMCFRPRLPEYKYIDGVATFVAWSPYASTKDMNEKALKEYFLRRIEEAKSIYNENF